MMRFIFVGIVVLMAAGIGFVGFSWYAARNGEQPYGGPFTLTDQKGAEITQAALRGHPSAVFFGFTHCPEVCPTTLFELSGWLKTLGDEGKDIRAFFVSVDPERDGPQRWMPMSAISPTASPASPAIRQRSPAMAKAFGIYSRKVDTGDGDYTMDHTASILLLDSKGAFFGTIAYGENPDTAVAKLKRLAAEG